MYHFFVLVLVLVAVLLMKRFRPLNPEAKNTLKIADFDELREHSGTVTMTFKGTCGYMAPEVLTKQHYSNKSDVWSYGVIVWEMLTGKIPHTDLSLHELIKKAESDVLAVALPESIPEIFTQLLSYCFRLEEYDGASIENVLKLFDNATIAKQRAKVRLVHGLEFYDKLKKPDAKDHRYHLIAGIAILHDEFFVLHQSGLMLVYNMQMLAHKRRFNVDGLGEVIDIKSCDTRNCLYIMNMEEKEVGLTTPTAEQRQNNEIIKVDAMGKVIKLWTVDGTGQLSVTRESNILLTAKCEGILFVCPEYRVQEYTSDGSLVHTIRITCNSNLVNPWHAIKLTSSTYAISHGGRNWPLHRVCIIDKNGIVLKGYGEKFNRQLLNCPCYLEVDGNGNILVADHENSRILVLNSNLNCIQTKPMPTRPNLNEKPKKVIFDKCYGRVFVVASTIHKLSSADFRDEVEIFTVNRGNLG